MTATADEIADQNKYLNSVEGVVGKYARANKILLIERTKTISQSPLNFRLTAL